MKHEQIYDSLCVHDKRSNHYADIHVHDDAEDIPEPRVNCFCDNCFYRRDELALKIIELGARNKVLEGAFERGFDAAVALYVDGAIENEVAQDRAIAAAELLRGTK